MNYFTQIVIVSALNFRNLRHRLWQSLVVVAGMAAVSGVLLSMLSVTDGMRSAYLANGDLRNVIVVSHNAIHEGNSAIPRNQAQIVMNQVAIARASDGTPFSDAEFTTGIPVTLKKSGTTGFIRLHTFGKMGPVLRPSFHLVAGRMFRPGTRELIVGPRAQTKFKAMSVGDKVILPNGQWPIVGMFATGDLLDGELVGDTETLMQAMRHKDYNTVLARLASSGTIVSFRKALKADPTLVVDTMSLPDWNRMTSDQTTAFFHVLVYGVGAILAVGALFGCFNTMYAAVESRGREIATLRALGYGAFPVAFSVMLEAAVLSVLGALAGAAIAWSLYDGVQGDMGSDFFKLTVSPAMIGMAVLWAVGVAFFGGLLPSIKATRRPIAMALRAT